MKNVWQCEKCGKTYDIKREADGCELSHKKTFDTRDSLEVIVKSGDNLYRFVANVTEVSNYYQRTTTIKASDNLSNTVEFCLEHTEV